MQGALVVMDDGTAPAPTRKSQVYNYSDMQ